jgi:hypothetical protein
MTTVTQAWESYIQQLTKRLAFFVTNHLESVLSVGNMFQRATGIVNMPCPFTWFFWKEHLNRNSHSSKRRLLVGTHCFYVHKGTVQKMSTLIHCEQRAKLIKKTLERATYDIVWLNCRKA